MMTPASRTLSCRITSWCSALLILGSVLQAAEDTNSPVLTVKRIFSSGEFDGESATGRWLEDSSGYTTFETSKAPGGGRDLVRHDPKTDQQEILVKASELVPPHESSPPAMDDHTWSKDRSKLLIFTNTRLLSCQPAS